MPSLTVTPRTEIGKSSALLAKEGLMPAVVYGHKQEATSVSLPIADFTRILRESGESVVIDIEGLGKPMQVLIHDIDRDPISSQPRHADLYAIEKGAKVDVAVPLSFVGESLAVKMGANLVKVLHELQIEAAPADLPQELEIDISSLGAVGDQIHVKDLVLPKGVVTHVDPEEVVAIAQEVEVETETETAAPDMASIEVEKKGKDEEEAS
jgi:large subunit ribosomal protein L25